MTNEVEISEQQLAAEAARIDAPADENAAPAEQPGETGGELAVIPGDLSPEQAEAIAAGYKPAAVMLIGQGAAIIAPAWDITRDECEQLGGALALAMAHWFPNQQLPPKYAALLGLAGTAWAIAEARRDPQTGKLRPMRRRAPASAASVVEGSAPSGGFGTAV